VTGFHVATTTALRLIPSDSAARYALFVLAAAIALTLVPVSAQAARPASARERQAVSSALVTWLCDGRKPTLERPCRVAGEVDKAHMIRSVRVPFVSISQIRLSQSEGYAGAAFATYQWRQMAFISDDSFQGGRWRYVSGSRWSTVRTCVQFGIEGKKAFGVSSYLDVNEGATRDAAMPVLRLYGNAQGLCPVRNTPRPGVKPGWTTASAVSTCSVYGKYDKDPSGLEYEDFASLKITGPSAATFCGRITTASGQTVLGATFSLTPFPSVPGQHMPVICSRSIGSDQLGTDLGLSLAPATYKVEIRAGNTWLERGDTFAIGC
jgi:hypothetical protein